MRNNSIKAQGARQARHSARPSPTLSPTDPVPRGLLTLRARAGQALLFMDVLNFQQPRQEERDWGAGDIE